MIQRARPTARPRSLHGPRPGPWLAIAVSALVARLALAWLERDAPPLAPDPRLGDIAAHLARGLGFALGDPVAPTAALPPLPPLLLAGLYRALGERPELSAVLGAMAGAATCLALARLGTVLYGPSVGRSAGLGAALAPLLVRGGWLPQEALLSLTLVMALAVGAEWVRAPSTGRAIATGVALGACAQCGALALVMPPVFLAWAWRPLGLALPPRQPFRQVAWLALGVACVLFVWAGRNAFVLHAPVPVSTSSGVAWLAGNNPVTWGDRSRRGGAIDVRGVEPYASRLSALGEVEGDRFARGEAVRFLSTRPPAELGAVVIARLRRLASLSLLPDDPATPRRRRPWDAPLAALEAALLALALGGATRALSGPRRWFQALPLLAIVVLAAASLMVSGSSRVRLAVEPLLVLLAALGLTRLRRRLHLRGRGLRVLPARTASEV